jgi:hypothetical protein
MSGAPTKSSPTAESLIVVRQVLEGEESRLDT